MIRPEDNIDEQQKLDEARGGQDVSFEDDSDYFSERRSQERLLESEYGSEISKNDRMDDKGNYVFDMNDTGGEINLNKIQERRQKLYNLQNIKDIITGMYPDEVFPHLKDLESSGFMRQVIPRRGVGNVLLGLDFLKDGAKGPVSVSIIVRQKEGGKYTDGFEFSRDKNSASSIKLFKDRLEEARKKCRERPSGFFEDEVRSEISGTSDFTSASESEDTVLRNPDQDLDDEDQGALGDRVRFNRGSEEVSIERQQDNRDLASVIDEEVEKTKFELIEEVEDDLQGVRDKLMARFTKLHRDNEIAPFGEEDYLEHIEDLLNPISNMRFFKNQEFFTDTDMTADQLYDQQMKYLEDNIKDIDKRVAKEKAKGERANEELLKAYKGLNDCIDLKMDTLNLYFERPVEGEYFRRQVRRLVRRNGRLAFERGKRWIKAKFPEFLAGITVSIGTIVFSIYELAENMGRGIVEQGQKALKNLGKKIKELAEKQGGAVGAVLHVVGSLLEHGAEGLNVLRDHFIAVSIIIILLITGSYYFFKGVSTRQRGVSTRQRGPKVRVRREEHKGH